MNSRKFKLISRFFTSSNLDFCFKQETKISDDSVPSAFSSDGLSFWAPALGSCGGVVILCSEAYAGNVSVFGKEM